MKEVRFDENGNEVEVVEVEEVGFFKAHKKEIIIGACVVAAAAIGGVVAYNIHENNKEARLALESSDNTQTTSTEDLSEFAF